MNSRANEGFQGPGIQQVAEGTKDLEFGNLTWGALCVCVHGCAYVCACVYLCVHVCVCACVYVLVCVCVFASGGQRSMLGGFHNQSAPHFLEAGSVLVIKYHDQ